MRYGYFRPTLREDANEMVQACHQCQIHDNDHHIPRNEYYNITTPVPFAIQWGMDLLSLFTKAKGGKEYLVIVVVDYFTRWIEVKVLISITSK